MTIFYSKNTIQLQWKILNINIDKIRDIIVKSTTDLGKDALNNPKKYKGFMGVSIPHKFFAKKRMKHYFPWFSKTFEEFVVILMDDPEKYNFIVFKNLDEEEALRKSRKVGNEIKASYEKVLRGNDINNVRVITFRDILEDSKYKEILNTIQEEIPKNNSLQNDLENLMKIGVGNKIDEFVNFNKLSTNEAEDIRDTLFNYIVEELASIIYLTEIGYTIEVDPTIEVTTKKFLYESKFDNLPKELNLSRRGHIYAHPEGIIKNSY